MKKNYSINMTMLGAHFQMASNECTNFQKNIFLRICMNKKTCPQSGNRQTDRQADTNMPPPPLFVYPKAKNSI